MVSTEQNHARDTLLRACANGNLVVVKRLLQDKDLNMDPNMDLAYGRTPLMVAARHGTTVLFAGERHGLTHLKDMLSW